MNNHLTPRDAVSRVGQHLGYTITLVDRYDLGDEGAYRVIVDGTSCVFKYWSGERSAALRLPDAVAAHRVLRQCGWPLPDIYAWRSEPHLAFVLEAQMPGSRVDSVSDALCQKLLALLFAVPPAAADVSADSQAWVTSLEQSLQHDVPLSPCRPSALKRTARGRVFLARAQRAFAPARPALAAARDVIHGDVSAGNVLCDDTGALVAVLDWQHSGIGHRGFDLIGLEWDLALRLDVGSASALARVTAHVNAQIEEPVRTFCRAYYGVWNLSWALGTPDEPTVVRAADALEII